MPKIVGPRGSRQVMVSLRPVIFLIGLYKIDRSTRRLSTGKIPLRGVGSTLRLVAARSYATERSGAGGLNIQFLYLSLDNVSACFWIS